MWFGLYLLLYSFLNIKKSVVKIFQIKRQQFFFILGYQTSSKKVFKNTPRRHIQLFKSFGDQPVI